MEFRRLEKKDKEAYRRFIENWGEEPIQPFSASERTDDYDSLLQLLEKEIKGKEGWVPSDTFFLFKEDDILGAINLRYALNDFLEQAGGHIGYGVAPTHRGKGYATYMLEKSLVLYQEKDFDRVLITAKKENQTSRRVIEKAGGALVDIREHDGEAYARYWV